MKKKRKFNFRCYNITKFQLSSTLRFALKPSSRNHIPFISTKGFIRFFFRPLKTAMIMTSNDNITNILHIRNMNRIVISNDDACVYAYFFELDIFKIKYEEKNKI